MISVNGDTLLSTQAVSYQWYEVTTGPIPAGIFQYYVATLGGNYFVCITDAFGCSACSDTVHVYQEIVHEFDLNASFSLFPNPASDKVFIRSAEKIGHCFLRIQDATGRIVLDESITFNNSSAEISIKDLAKGSYLIQLLDDKKKILFTAPLVKQ